MDRPKSGEYFFSKTPTFLFLIQCALHEVAGGAVQLQDALVVADTVVALQLPGGALQLVAEEISHAANKERAHYE